MYSKLFLDDSQKECVRERRHLDDGGVEGIVILKFVSQKLAINIRT
jgi:hypothetical protein